MSAQADVLRVATFNTELQRSGPGLLLRDIHKGDDPQINAALKVIATVSPDVLLLQNFDYDLGNKALSAFNEAIGEYSRPYPYLFATRPNSGLQTGLDMDGDGRTAEARDAQGYGQFSGQGGMAILSRHPIQSGEFQDYSSILWRDLPDAMLPQTPEGSAFPSEEAQSIQRLSTTAHWVIPIEVEGLGPVHLLAFHAGPPVFDGPEDRNGKRNHDEIMFWVHYLDGVFGPVPSGKFLVVGAANNDPIQGEGIKSAINALVNDPRLQDPRPRSAGSVAATGDPFDTVDWDDPEPGNLRVEYVLPSSDWQVTDAGVYWPTGKAGEVANTASRHRLVWVDLTY